MNAEVESVAAMRHCPRWDRCNAPKCPLDTLRAIRTKTLEGEPECNLSHNMRQKLRRRIASENR